MPRGHLRVYLGVAPGVGSTHALLDEAQRRRARGADVVVGVVDDRGREHLRSLLAGLEGGGDGSGLDIAHILARGPSVALVDNLADPRGPEPGSPPRWAEVERLLDAGIDVVGTVDIRAVESLAEVVERITGGRPVHTIPDSFLRDADQLELVDMSPQALRRRLAHGALYAPEDIDAARSAGFRPEALGALRELALVWMAGAVRGQHDAWARSLGAAVDESPAADVRERLLVALSGGPETEQVLHRATRLASRTGSDVLAVHVLTESTQAARGADRAWLRERAEAVGAPFQEVVGDDVATALLDVVRAERVTQVVVGPGRPGPRRWLSGPAGRQSLADQLVGRASGVDVHVVTAVARGEQGAAAAPPRRVLSTRRQVVGFTAALSLPAVTTWALLVAGTGVGLAGDSLLLMLGVVVIALVGGLWPAVLGAVVGSTMLNYFFIPPVRTFRVAETHNVSTLVAFVLVALLVSAVVHRAAATAAEATRASAESRTLSAIASSTLHGEDALPALLEQLRSSFGMTSVALLERVPAGPGDQATWRVVHSRGPEPPARPPDADVQVPAGEGLVLALSGRTLAAADRTVLQAFAARAQGLIERESLARGAAVATRLEATERLRDALLAAVGHDLRTPLASATAAVSSLRSRDVTWSSEEREELLATAEESLIRLGRLVADLLDLSRLRAGVLGVECEPVWLDEILPPALDELGDPARAVTLRVPVDLPAALADPALLTRALVNVTGNALRHSPPDHPPAIVVSAASARVEVRIVDRGPGIPNEEIERVFIPFQRLGDTDNRAGLGLGLALSRGLIEAMGGTLTPEETPGGGLTMVISLPAAPAAESGGAAEPGQRERQASG